MRMKAGNSGKNIEYYTKVYNKNADWLSNIKSELGDLDRAEDIILTKKDLKKMLQKLFHWKVPGKDGLHTGILDKSF